MSEYARNTKWSIIVPVYEKDGAGILTTHGSHRCRRKYLGKYRKNHIPQTGGFWEKYFKPGNMGYPVFQTRYAKVGVYICYDRHFPEGARALGVNGAEIVYNPSATTVGQSQYLWKLEQPARCSQWLFYGLHQPCWDRKPWNLGKFYGTSYFVNPLGEIFATASEDNDELLIAEFDLDLIDQVRSKWQFYRDRRPETYDDLTQL
jgi:N-carbamoylputrescine amidase